METESTQLRAEDTQDSRNQFNMLYNKDEAQANAGHKLYPFPTETDQLKATVKIEKCSNIDNGLLPITLKSELAELYINENIHQNEIKAVVLEKIPKIESNFTCSDDDIESANSNSESASECDPERDPFEDVDCDPIFFQTSQSHNSIDSAGPNRLHESADVDQILNPPSSAQQRILPSENTPRNSAHFTTLVSKLKCELCLEIQCSGDKLKIHVKICATSHKNRHRFCVPCNKLFFNPRVYRQHALNIHGIKELEIRSFKCNICKRSTFARKDSFEAHLASHRNRNTGKNDETLKSFNCLQCALRFTNLDGLRKHMVSHTDEAPFKCTVPNCGKPFIYNCHLKDHIRRFHSDERPFKCPQPNCGKAFNQKQNLGIHLATIHVQVQDTSVSFKCPEPNCNKTFKAEQYVKNHLRNHNRRHKCTEPGCSAIYARLNLLNSHVASKHTQN